MKDFLYFLLKEDGRSYTENGGVVSSASTPTPLKETPDGWLDVAVAWERNLADIGTVRNFSAPLHFVLSARIILLTVFLTKNIEEKVYLLIQRLNLDMTLTTWQFIYRYFYRGSLDFSTLKDDGERATINIMEGGTSQAFRSNRGTTYEIDMDEYETVLMDGIILEGQLKFLIPQVDGPTNSDGVPLTYISREGSAPYIDGVSQDFSVPPDDYFLVNSGVDPQTVHVKGDVTFIASSGTQQVIARLYKITGTTLTSLVEQIFNPSDTNVHTVSYDTSVTLNQNEKLYLFLRCVPKTISSDAYATYTETNFSVSFNSRFRASQVKALKLSVLFEKLTEKITGARTNCDSSYLKDHDNLLITCGDAVRGLDTVAGSPVRVKISLNQFFDFCKTVLACGIGVEKNKITIRPYDYFLDPSNPVSLGEVKDFAWSFAADLMGNTVKIGYPDQQIDDVNGKYEFNNTHLYQLPQTRVTKELTFQSPILAQPYLIETRRINLEGKVTTDNQQDNDLFVLNTQRQSVEVDLSLGQFFDGYFVGITGTIDITMFPVGSKIEITGTNLNNGVYTILFSGATTGGALLVVREPLATETITATVFYGSRLLKRETYDVMTGVPTNTVFNVEELTPKRLLKKQMRWINSLLWHFTGNVKFLSTEKNAELYTEKGASYVSEKSDEIIGSDRLFIPLYFDFETKVPIDLVDTLEQSPNRCFSFTVEGVHLKGFLIKAGLAPATEQQQTFKLLCAPDVDVSQLIP